MRAPSILLLLVGCGSDPAPTPISVVSIDPAPDAVDVILETQIRIELSAAPPGDFDVELVAATGEPIPHDISTAGALVTITPADPLWLATDYDVRTLDFASRFTTRDGTWRNLPIATQTMAAAAPLGGGAAPSMAVLPEGTVLASWESGGEIHDQKLTLAHGWQPMPNRLDIIGDADFVEVAAASPSRAVAGYQHYLATNADIAARTYDGSAWSMPSVVSPYRVGTIRYDQYVGGIAATETSYALTLHRGEFDIDHFDVFAALHTNGAWSPLIAVEQLPGEASGSQIVADGRGGYVVVWIQRSMDRTATAVWMTTLSGTGTVGTPQKLDDGPGNTYGLALARSGDAIWIAWAHEQPGTKLRVNARSLRAGSLGAAHAFDLDGHAFGGEWVRITASAHGALLVYTHYGSVNALIHSGGSWSAPREIDARPAAFNDDVGRPALALDDRGNATIVWTRVPATGRRTSMVSRGRAGTWSAPARLDEGTASTYAWTAGVDAAGRVTALWTQSEQTGYTVWGAHLR